MSKKYTIVIPSMNGSKYLKHAIDSVLLENSKNFQLVVSINHSTDSSYEMLKDYKDDRLKVVSPPKKLSMAGHYEWCIDQADSEWLTIIGDDDGIMPGFFDYMDYLTNKWTQVEAISFKRAYFFWPGAEKIFGNIVLHYHKSKNEKLLSSKSMLLKVFSSIKEHYDLPQLYTNNMIRKSLINRIKSKSKGKFYHEMTPDVYSGVVIALSIKNYLRVDRPIFWTGSSPKSLGVAIADRESDKKENSNQNKSNEHFNLAIEDGLSISKEVNKDLYKKSDLSLVIYAYSALTNTPFNSNWKRSKFIKKIVFSSALAKNLLPNSLKISSKKDFFYQFKKQINQNKMSKFSIYCLFIILFNIILFKQFYSLLNQYFLKCISYFSGKNKLIYIKNRKNLDTITDANKALINN
tara:strand:+ start:3060 stop:4277 length:1218 start_codon:yes stop_codon:yes gene_type:complete